MDAAIGEHLKRLRIVPNDPRGPDAKKGFGFRKPEPLRAILEGRGIASGLVRSAPLELSQVRQEENQHLPLAAHEPMEPAVELGVREH